MNEHRLRNRLRADGTSAMLKARCQSPTIRLLIGVALLLCALASRQASAQERTAVEILTNADSIFFDRDLGLRLRGIDPGSEAILTVSAIDARGQSWWSQNAYRADETGEIDLSQQPPVRGTYSGVHSMGPFWSLVGAERFYTSSDASIRIQASAGYRVLAERSVRWMSPRDHPGVMKESFRRSDLVADLYLPANREGPVPAVVVLGGSGGGFNSERASLLATHGYAALDVAYFGVEGTPEYFVETMPLEYFMGAVSVLERDSRIDASRIAVMGRSYGAQLALLLASHEPRIHLVIAEAPSSFITGTPATYPVGPVAPAWSLDGAAFAFLNRQGESDDPVHPKQISVSIPGDEALDQMPAADEAAIPVERINGPVLFVTGEADRLWASTAMAKQLRRRMAARGFEHVVQHAHFPESGHNMGGGEQAYGVSNLPPKDRSGSGGGTRQGNSIAGVAAWETVLAFLRSNLR